MKIMSLRPKMSLKEPKTGWKTYRIRHQRTTRYDDGEGCTVLVSKKLVPLQNPSMAVPWSTVVILGMATDSVVASSAAISVSTRSETTAR
jgi:hypothetical protein